MVLSLTLYVGLFLLNTNPHNRFIFILYFRSYSIQEFLKFLIWKLGLFALHLACKSSKFSIVLVITGLASSYLVHSFILEDTGTVQFPGYDASACL